MVMGPKTENDCAGDGQKQFTEKKNSLVGENGSD
jgi:hypothetical protein